MTTPRISILLLVLLLLPALPVRGAEHPLAAAAYARLDQVRAQKKVQLLKLFEHLEEKVEGLKSDAVMLDFFQFMTDLARREEGQGDRRSAELQRVVAEYVQALDQYYLANYLDFYDVLFVAAQGEVFHSIRKDGVYRQNLFAPPLAETGLARRLRKDPEVFFVDYQYFSPAARPAAFFVVPVHRSGQLQGWIVLQYAVTRLNNLMVDYQELGDTGEVYLVNHDHLLLTNSRFKAEPASLQLRVDTEAVDLAFAAGRGHKRITGYRGVPVFTAFEKFSRWGCEWALVASIEEDEVLTRHFLERIDELSGPLLQHLAKQTGNAPAAPLPRDKPQTVEIDEFRKSEDAPLHTRGVSTCTAVVVRYPGRFGYLAHISPFDKAYGQTQLTNQLKDLVTRIKNHDIYLQELRELHVVIVARHPNSFHNAVDKLTRYGLRLSQITFAYHPDARYANVTCAPQGGEIVIEWVPEEPGRPSLVQVADSLDNLATAVARIIDYR